MDDKKFIGDNQPIVRSVKKQAKIRALTIFIGTNLFFALLLNAAFFIMIPFTLFAAFSIYFHMKKYLLHQQFPDKFEDPNLETDGDNRRRYVPVQDDVTRVALHPLNPTSPNYWGLRKNH